MEELRLAVGKLKKKTTKKKTSKKTVKKTNSKEYVYSQDSIARSALEVYKTKDKNIETPSKNEEKEGFVLHNGTITEIAYFDELVSTSFEHDYEDISSSGSVSFVEVDGTRFYKGTKVLLKKEQNPKKWSDMDNVLLGFITEQTFTEDGVDIKIAGSTKLLDAEKQFTFKNTKISKILKEMVESAGLKINIDTTGLKDKKVDYTNVSSSSSSSNNASSNSVPQSIQELADSIAGSETDEYKKFEKAHNWGLENITYSSYECSQQSRDPEKCYKARSHLNCGDTSILMCAIYTALGLENYIIHGDYHFWNIVVINGKKYASDCSGNHKINQVWSTSQHPNSPFKGSKVKGYKICT